MGRGIPVKDSPAGAAWDRVVSVCVLAAAIGVVTLLASVTPDVRGHGTHVQLGMDACGWPAVWGVPCPACGMTTAACHLVHGSPWRALRSQPFGALLGAFGIGLAVYAAYCLATRRSFVDRLMWLPYGRFAVWAVVLFLLSWLFKYATFQP